VLVHNVGGAFVSGTPEWSSKASPRTITGVLAVKFTCTTCGTEKRHPTARPITLTKKSPMGLFWWPLALEIPLATLFAIAMKKEADKQSGAASSAAPAAHDDDDEDDD